MISVARCSFALPAALTQLIMNTALLKDGVACFTLGLPGFDTTS